MSESLSIGEAFDAARRYLEMHESHGDTVGQLIVDMTIDSDGVPIDPATWIDWRQAARAAKGADSSEDSILLDEVATRGPLALEAAHRLASRGVEGAVDAILTALRACAPSDTRDVGAFVGALDKLGQPAPTAERNRLGLR